MSLIKRWQIILTFNHFFFQNLRAIMEYMKERAESKQKVEELAIKHNGGIDWFVFLVIGIGILILMTVVYFKFIKKLKKDEKTTTTTA